MMKKILIFGVTCATACLCASSWAQTYRSWRCPGNYYTNDAKEVRNLKGCTPISDNLTVVRLNGSRAPARNHTSSATPVRANTASTTKPQGMQVSPQLQRQRDSDARTILEGELSRMQTELTVLQGQFNNGKPERLLSEVQDEAAYQNRVARLTQEIERKATDIAAIQNELARMK